MQGIREIIIHEKLCRIRVDKSRLRLSVHDRLQRRLPGGVIEKLRVPCEPLLDGGIVLGLRNGHRSDFAVKILPGHLCHPGRQVSIRAEPPAGHPFRHRFKVFLVDNHIHAAAVRKLKITCPVRGHHQLIGQSRHVHHCGEIIRHDAFQLPVLHIGVRLPVPDGYGSNGLPARYHILDIGLLPFGEEGGIRIHRPVVSVSQNVHPVPFIDVHLPYGVIDLMEQLRVLFPHNGIKIVGFNDVQRPLIFCFPQTCRQDCVYLSRLQSRGQLVRASVFHNPVGKTVLLGKFLQALLLASALHCPDHHALIGIVVAAVEPVIVRLDGQNGAVAPDGQ